nr:MAG TPA: Nuclease [Caudoviricetes sp.]
MDRLNEHELQNEIRLALSDSCVLFRINVGGAYTEDGRWFSSGVPKGYSDLSGVRRSDGRAVFIEVKTPTGRIRPEQRDFIEAMQKCGALAGFARSIEEAKRIVED